MTEKEFVPNVITNARNCDRWEMDKKFIARVKKIFPEATEEQINHITFAAVQIFWMLEGWDKP